MRVFLIILLLALHSWAGVIFNGGIEIISIKSVYAGDLKVNNKPVSWLNHPRENDAKIALIPASYYAKNDINITNSLNGQSSL